MNEIFDVFLSLKIESDTVRLGAYDLRTKKDVDHVDVGIARIDSHADYSVYLVFHTNDIAMVHLKHDVEFTGIKSK